MPLMAAEARLRLAEIALLMGDARGRPRGGRGRRGPVPRAAAAGWVAMAAVVVTESRRRDGTPHRRRRRPARGGPPTRWPALGLVSAAVGADLTAGRAALALGPRRAGPAPARRGATGAPGAAPVLVRLRGRLAAALAAEARRRRPRRCCATAGPGWPSWPRTAPRWPPPSCARWPSGHGVELGLLGLGQPAAQRLAGAGAGLGWSAPGPPPSWWSPPPAPDGGRARSGAELAAVHAELAAARGADRAATSRAAGPADRPGAADPPGHLAPRGPRAAAPGRRCAPGALRRPARRRGAGVLRPLRRRGRGRRARPRPAPAASGWAAGAACGSRPTPCSSRCAGWCARAGRGRGQRLDQRPARAGAGCASCWSRRCGVGADTPLVVVPARGTHRLPWSALHTGAGGRRRPSATLWARQPRPARSSAAAGCWWSPARGLAGAEREVGRRRRAATPAPPCWPRRTSTADAVVDAIGRRRPGPPGLPRPAARGQPDVLRPGAGRRPAHRARAGPARHRPAAGGAGLLRLGGRRLLRRRRARRVRQRAAGPGHRGPGGQRRRRCPTPRPCR